MKSLSRLSQGVVVAMLQIPHSTLEVAPNTDLPEPLKYAHYDLEVCRNSDDDTNKFACEAKIEQDQPWTICGLRRRTFWIAMIVAIIVVAAAVGGAVGGTLASKSSRNGSHRIDPDTPELFSAAATPTSSTQTPASAPITTSNPTTTPTSAQSTADVTTTSVVGPSRTLLRDCPSANNTLYDVTHGDTTMSFRKACGISFVNDGRVNTVKGTVVTSLNDCIDLCAAYNINNKTQIASGASRICNSVCWRNTFEKINDLPGGMCFGFTSQNSSGTFSYALPAETRCDSAALINQAF
jgi:hypothetical protein